jgi:hypothetical protein
MVSAVSLWIHVESLLVIFLNMILLGIFWIFEDEDFVKKNLHYSIALLVFTSVALILERPWRDLTSIEYDKISVVHWFIFGLISLFWIAVFYFKRYPMFSPQGRTRRFTIASLGAVIVALCVLLILPGFYRGGYADIDPRIVPIWLSKVQEVQSPLSRNWLMPLIQLLGSAVTGIAYVVFVLRKEPDKNSKGWIFILSAILLFTLAGFWERRLLLYGNIITLVPLAAILGRALKWEVDHVKLLFRIFILPFTVIFFCVAFLSLGFICQEIAKKDNVSKSYNQAVPLSELCDELNNLNEGNARKPRILAFIYYGPEILYRTGYEVIATPHHRNALGILDAYWIMTAASDEKAHALIHRRGIDMILVTNDPGERKYYSAAPGGSIFYDRLKAEGSVNWLREVELPPRLSSAYRLFRVVG